jgi:hypothetical protein
MELNRGDVIVNLKSSKEYAVCDAKILIGSGALEYRVSYAGIRDGKSYGPIRTSVLSENAAGWGKTAKTATFAPIGWHIVEVK